MLLSFLRRYLGALALLTLCAGIFAAVIGLYGYPTDGVAYAWLLCAAAASAFLGVGYYRHVRRVRTLREIGRAVSLCLAELPEPRDGVEAEYQELLKALERERRAAFDGAEAAQRDASDYYTMWVHQIKTPIAAMALLLQQRDTAENAALSAELFRIEQYADMALQYIRLDSDRTDLLLRRRSVDDIVRGCLRKFAGQFISRRLSVHFEPTGAEIMTDEKWLSFIIEQLLSNALKYTREGGVRIYGDGSCLTVEDTGMGVSAEDLPRIGERGFTGYNGRADKKSTGLGLYLCRQAADKLGCRLSFRSEEGRGLAASVLFPAETRKPE